MNYERIYNYRFRNVNKETKLFTWKIVSDYLSKLSGFPNVVLDPAAGECEFINMVGAKEKWAIDFNEGMLKFADKDVKTIVGNCLEVKLIDNYFDGIFVTHLLQNLKSQEEIAHFLDLMYRALKPGGKIVILGPNFKYCSKNYFDFADHNLILTETRLCEHLYASRFEIEIVIPKFLPLTFRSGLPITKSLVKIYLNFPLIWKIFGKQFLLIGKKTEN